MPEKRLRRFSPTRIRPGEAAELNSSRNFDSLVPLLNGYAEEIEARAAGLDALVSKVGKLIPPAILGAGKIYDVRAFGTLAKAIAYIGANFATLYITNEQAIAVNTTIPSNISIVVLKGGSFAISTGVTLTINGAFEAGRFQVFSGLGTVVFAAGSVAMYIVHWWGAAGDGATNDTAAIQRAVDACYAAGGGVVYFPPGTYAITSIFKEWTSSISILFRGAGMKATYIIRHSSAGVLPLFHFKAPTNILETYSGVEDMSVTGSAATRVGTGFKLEQMAYCQMKNVYAIGFDNAVDNVGSLVNEFYDIKFQHNNTGFLARKSGMKEVVTADAGTDTLTTARWISDAVETGYACSIPSAGGNVAPGGLTLGVTYYLIKLTDKTVKLAATYANALAGTAINLTTAGSGVLTLQGIQIYCNSINFYNPKISENLLHGVDIVHGINNSFQGVDMEVNGTASRTFTADASTDIITPNLSDGSLLPPTGTAIRFSNSGGALPTASMTTTTFTVNTSTDAITMATDLDLPAGYPVTVSTTTTLPPELVAATPYYLIPIPGQPGIYRLATSMDNAKSGDYIDLTTAGVGTHTVTPTGLVSDVDYFYIYINATTGKVASNYDNARNGIAINLTGAGTGAHTIGFVGTGAVIIREFADEEIGGAYNPSTRQLSSPGAGYLDISKAHFESNRGRTVAVERTTGMTVSVSMASILNSETTTGGCALYVDGGKYFIGNGLIVAGPSDVTEVTSRCNTTGFRFSILGNLTNNAVNPGQVDISGNFGTWPGYSSDLDIYRNSLLKLHQNVSDDIYHSIFNDGSNNLRLAASSGQGIILAGVSASASDLISDGLHVTGPVKIKFTGTPESADNGTLWLSDNGIAIRGLNNGGTYAFILYSSTVGDAIIRNPVDTTELQFMGDTLFNQLTGATQRIAQVDADGYLQASNTIADNVTLSNGNLIVATPKTPASASDTGTAGMVCWDANYIYVCTATDTWKRTAIATW